MRPPVLPSGNLRSRNFATICLICFNEAAGFTQRKLTTAIYVSNNCINRFNEAAGFTQRKHEYVMSYDQALSLASMRPPVLPSGNVTTRHAVTACTGGASMRPPVLPSGNTSHVAVPSSADEHASMRPPVLPSGNFNDLTGMGGELELQ